MKRVRSNHNRLQNTVLSAIKIVLLACILTAVLVLILAVTMKWEWIGMEDVDTANTCIKAISACFAGIFAASLDVKRKWLAAGLLGMLYMALSYGIFSILNGAFYFNWSNLSDLLMTFACASCSCIAIGILLESFSHK